MLGTIYAMPPAKNIARFVTNESVLRKDVRKNKLDMTARGTGKGKVVETMETDFLKALKQVQADDPMFYPVRVEWEKQAQKKQRAEDIMLMANMVKNRPVKLYDAETATYTPTENQPTTHDAEPTFWDGVVFALGVSVACIGVAITAIFAI